MGVLYRSYCYESADTVGGLIQSEGLREGGASPWYVSSSAVNGSALNLSVSFFDGSPPVLQSVVVSLPLVSCISPGPVSNYSGLSLSDVNTTAWLVAAVLISVWCIKQIRRAL